MSEQQIHSAAVPMGLQLPHSHLQQKKKNITPTPGKTLMRGYKTKKKLNMVRVSYIIHILRPLSCKSDRLRKKNPRYKQIEYA